MKRSSFILMMAGVVLMAMNSCKDKSHEGTSRINVRLTDKPSAYQEVNVDIQGVEVHTTDGGWVALSVNKGIYNLLKFTAGLDTLIASSELPAGHMSQIRLILGSNNTVKVRDTLYPMSTPSADQSGLKLDIHQDLNDGVTYTIKLDFDAGRSVIQTGNSAYKLKPVIRTVVTASDGAIKGVVTPAAAKPYIMAVNGTDTFGTYSNVATGAYLIQAVKAGIYKVIFVPVTPYIDTTVFNVAVNTGAVTDMGTIQIK